MGGAAMHLAAQQTAAAQQALPATAEGSVVQGWGCGEPAAALLAGWPMAAAAAAVAPAAVAAGAAAAGVGPAVAAAASVAPQAAAAEPVNGTKSKLPAPAALLVVMVITPVFAAMLMLERFAVAAGEV